MFLKPFDSNDQSWFYYRITSKVGSESIMNRTKTSKSTFTDWCVCDFRSSLPEMTSVQGIPPVHFSLI